MEDFYMNITSQDNSYDYSNSTSNYSNITSNYSNITSNYSNMTYNYSNITYDYSNMTSNYSNMTSNYSNITSNYSNMTYNYSNITYDYSNMTSNYSNITSNYSNITSNYSNITSNYSNIIDDYSNIPYDYSDYYYDDNDFYEWYYSSPWFIINVVICVIIGVGLFLTLIAIYTLYSEVRNDHVAPIYVINLLISDLIQICCVIIDVVPTDPMIYYISDIYYSAVVASVGFMVCIALERYLVIAHPLWYRFRRTIKSSVMVCVLVWVLALVFGLIYYFSYHDTLIFAVVILLPLPLFIFFLGGTLKALSASISVPSDEKRRIVAVLVVVLLIYTLLFLPKIISELTLITTYDYSVTLIIVSVIFIQLSPLADLILYIFMRKGTIDRLLSSVCCCRMDSDDTNSSSV